MLSEEALRARAQRTLIDLLHTELGLGPTFVQSALLAKSAGHREDYVQAKEHATKAADAVRHFMGRVADDVVRTEIGRELAELDRLISTL
jgi:hypothetical protein